MDDGRQLSTSQPISGVGGGVGDANLGSERFADSNGRLDDRAPFLKAGEESATESSAHRW